MDTGQSLNQGIMSLITTLDNLSSAFRKDLSHTNATVYKDEVELYFLLHSIKISLNKGACSQTESELTITFIDNFLSMNINHNKVISGNANLAGI
ncbi:hypothetical protein CXF83_09905 [Shewanella sp. Choline-02u-19]|uniref:hypothetical protein n=1 Tax=unclassified Shewanella TaxID=196818 RepID=UPI000C328C5B|nr:MULTISPECIES: hypothetical protein [unclassified Shewanella]PKH62859.1 hypothetical protein CXF84_00795 [Shewanella sp. Bg11-22]PKI27018.1 hypothetical protein CXF83_09905 [Shewanella sp. Choline-02u-19]